MIPYNFNVQMDLLSDWRNFLVMQFRRFPFLKECDYVNLPLDKLSIFYFNWLNRLIQPSKRKVHYSKEFICPPNEQDGLFKLEQKIIAGENLIPHLTRTIKDIRYNDLLLNDWGIHHLHLSSKVEADGFVKRNEYILYALFNKNDAYLIQIMDHKSFSKQELLRILHKNWPESISKYRAIDLKPSSTIITDEDIQQYRKSGLMVLVEVEGVVYFPMGGGLSAARTNVIAGRDSDIYIDWLRRIEKHILKNIHEYLGDVVQKLGYHPKVMIFKLMVNSDDNFFVLEKNSLVSFDIGKP
jgi:hypothetical protein